MMNINNKARMIIERYLEETDRVNFYNLIICLKDVTVFLITNHKIKSNQEIGLDLRYLEFNRIKYLPVYLEKKEAIKYISSNKEYIYKVKLTELIREDIIYDNNITAIIINPYDLDLTLKRKSLNVIKGVAKIL